jgi:putative ABC transport system permease protein
VTSAPPLEATPAPPARIPRGRGTGGGLPARRAVVRWAWRLFRREWRQQVLVVALLTLAVAAAVGGSVAVHGTVPTVDGDLGSADQRIDITVGEDPDEADRPPMTAAEVVEQAEAAFGSFDPIGSRSVSIPGSVESVELRAQDPDGLYSASMLELLDGSYPRTAGEIAVTDELAATLGAGVGDTVELGDETRTVVGHVENPAELGDEFALLPPSEIDEATTVSVLVNANDAQTDAFGQAVGGYGSQERNSDDDPATAGVLTLAVSTVVLMLVALIAAAGFVVVAQRRLRQLGMLAAVGATERRLRLVLLADGAVVGVVAALIGTALGLAAWFIAAPRLENAAGHRIDATQVPWWLVAAGMALAVVTALVAAWWPARAVARIPITQALSARPQRPRPVRRSVLVAVALVVIGFVLLRRGLEDEIDPDEVAWVAGLLTLAVGFLLACPTVVRLLPPIAGRLPVAARLALRDLGRHQARSGAALAAIALGMGISVVIIGTGSADEYQSDRDDGPGNLADDQLLLHVGDPPALVPERTSSELDQMEDAVDRLAETFGDATVVPLDAAVDPRATQEAEIYESSIGGLPSDLLAEPLGDDVYDGHILHVATPEVLAWAGIDPASLDPEVDVSTPVTGDLILAAGINGRARVTFDPAPETLEVQPIDGPGYVSLPTSFVTPESLERQGLMAVRSGWLVEADGPLTDAELERARDAAARTGLFVESRRAPESRATLRSGATAFGLLIALGILAMTVGLLRSEAAGDLRTLTATGASSRVRRTITAATAAALGFLGAVVGTVAAYTALAARYVDDLAPLGRVPVVNLAVVLIGLPVAAAVAGWLLAGREPPALSRQPT